MQREVEEVADRLVAWLRTPLLREPAEGADVPGADEEVAVEQLRRDDGVEAVAEREQLLGEGRRKWVADACRGRQSYTVSGTTWTDSADRLDGPW